VNIEVRDARQSDCTAIAALYNHYVAMPAVTFEFDPVAPGEIARRIGDVQGAELPWLVALHGEDLVAYAYAMPWKGSRKAYRFSVESTVYVDAARAGQGIGVVVYSALIEALRARGIHAVIGGILLPNPASIALHERLGFRKVAQFDEVGFKQGAWLDVGYWQLLLGPPSNAGT
jgi:phosphinothricin acetyltransferase